MNITTKFNLNQKVQLINRDRRTEFVKCAFCDGKKRITCNNITRICPECYGSGGKQKAFELEWQLQEELTVGLVRAQVLSLKKDGIFENRGSYDPNNIEEKYEYMMYETGIGSGSAYYEENLFGTKEEAIKECKRRNNEGTRN